MAVVLPAFDARTRRGASGLTITSEGRPTMGDGDVDNAKGKLKKAAGDLTGDDDLRREGKVDEASGTVKEKAGDAADKVKEALRRDDD
jgi:uncharacterized protein YjbJ (UPF0337 family)